jgi:hypothetical protein
MHFGVSFAGTLMEALTNHNAIVYDDATNSRIRMRRILPTPGKLQGTSHVLSISS